MNILFLKQSIVKILTLLLLFLFAHSACAQSGDLFVFEKRNKQALSNVTIHFKNLTTKKIHFATTSKTGATNNIAKDKSLVTIYLIGYLPITDTILPNDSKSYYLEDDIFQLNQVVVTATRTKKALKDAPVITQVITAKQIESRGYITLQDVLEGDMPNIEFHRHGFTNDMNMQGIDARNILVLIDGERMAGETRGNVDYARLNTNDIERIEIVKGASSALYGSQAMGATINIITKTSKQKLSLNFSASLTSKNDVNFPGLKSDDEYHNFKKNLDRPNSHVSGTIGFRFRKLSSKTNFVAKSKDAYQLFDRKGTTKKFIDIDTTIHQPINLSPIGIEGFKDYSINQKLKYQLNKQFSIETTGSYYTHDKYDFTRDKKHDLYNDISKGLKVIYQGIDDQSLMVSFFSDTYQKHDYFEKLKKRSMTYRYILNNPKVIGTYRIKETNLITAGAEYIQESLTASIFTPNQLEKKNTYSAQIFVQEDIQLNPKSNIIAGLRAEYHGIYGGNLTPKLSFMHKWTPLTLRLNYASGYRSPSLKELYYNWDLLGLFTIKGNEDLKPETNNYFSSSAEFTNRRINTSISFYQNYFKNKIIGQWENNQEIYHYINTSKSRIIGLDLLLKIKLNKSLILKSAFSYTHDKTTENAIRLSSISPYTANAQVEYSIKKEKYSLTAIISGKYIGSKDFNVLEEINYRNKTTQAYYLVHLDGYSIWNFTISQHFTQNINLVLGVNNLLDYTADRITFNSSVTFGRAFFAKINIPFNLP